MKPAEAARILGLTLPTSADAVRAAFRAAIMTNHPDHNPGTRYHTVDALKEARDVLVNQTHGFQSTCLVCHNTGVVRKKGFKPISCPRGCKVKPMKREPARRK